MGVSLLRVGNKGVHHTVFCADINFPINHGNQNSFYSKLTGEVLNWGYMEVSFRPILLKNYFTGKILLMRVP
jgi:hypothetical protein